MLLRLRVGLPLSLRLSSHGCGFSISLAVFLFQDRLNLFDEIVDVFELPIDAGESNVRHVIKVDQLFHYQLSDGLAGNLGDWSQVDFLDDFHVDVFDLLVRDWTLPTSTFQTEANLFWIEGLFFAVLF